MDRSCQSLIETLRAARLVHPVGRVAAVERGSVAVTGLTEQARIGAHVRLHGRSGRILAGEVVRLTPEMAHVLTGTAPDGVAVGDRVVLLDDPVFAPSDTWIGRVIDPYGRPLDGLPLLRGPQVRPVSAPPPAAADRRGLGQRLTTGLAVLDTILPVARGQRIGLFAGSGVGKSRLLAHLATGVEADITVIALIGERGREVNEFVQGTLGRDGMRKSIVIAATSDQSALTRRRCALAAITVAEHFRDQGKQVLLLADSVTRFAEAHREIAAVSGEDLSLRGFPASLTPMITGLSERAGPGAPGQGDITAVFSVLVAGSDMNEPVADILRGVLDGHVVLSRDIAERGRYPAIDVLKSVSRSLPAVAAPEENTTIGEVRKLLGAYESAEVMIRAGLYTEGADPVLDQPCGPGPTSMRSLPGTIRTALRTVSAGWRSCCAGPGLLSVPRPDRWHRAPDPAMRPPDPAW